MNDIASLEIAGTPVGTRRDFLKLSGAALVGMLMPPSFKGALSSELEHTEADFFFVYHLQAKDLDGFAEAVKQCDVVVPEYIGWRPEDEVYFNNVSQGTIPKEQIRKDNKNREFLGALLEGIHNSKKPVRFLDVPMGSMLEREFYTVMNRAVPDYTQTFGDRVRSVITQLQDEAEWHREREDYILQSIPDMMQTIRTENLKAYSGKMKLLMEYGVAHTRLLHLANKQDVAGGDSRYPAPYTHFTHRDEAKRRYWFANDIRDPKKVALPNANLISSVIMEEILMNWFFISNLPQFPNTEAVASWLRDTSGLFSVKEVYELWEFQRLARKGKQILPSVPLLELRDQVAGKLREKHVSSNLITPGLSDSIKPPNNLQAALLPTRELLRMGVEMAWSGTAPEFV